MAANRLALILAEKELPIENGLLAGNGSRDGIDRFEDAYQRGSALIPS